MFDDYFIIENFFSDEDLLKFVDAAKHFYYEKAHDTNHPGERTKRLKISSPELYQLANKTFEYHLGKDKYLFDSYIQRIQAEELSDANTGWIHTDQGVEYTIVVYLNEDPDPKTGTTLSKPKLDVYDPNANLKFRNRYYGGDKTISKEDFAFVTKKHNDRFEDYLHIENKFNRALIFNSDIPHKQTSFGDLGNIRYTLLTFAYDKTKADDSWII